MSDIPHSKWPSKSIPTLFRSALAWFLFACSLPVSAFAAWMLVQITQESHWNPGPGESVFARVVTGAAIAIPIVSWLVLPKRRKSESSEPGETGATPPRPHARGRMRSHSFIIGAAPALTFLITAFSTYVTEMVKSHHAEEMLTTLRENSAKVTSIRSNPVIANRELGEIPEEVADVPALDLRVGNDAMKRYFLIGKQSDPQPPDGYRLLLVLPGGHGGANFSPFVRNIYKRTLDDRWLVAQLVAPEWNQRQIKMNVWPRNAMPDPAATFTTEEFADAVISDVQSRAPIAPDRIYLLAWSSSGPAAYGIALRTESPFAGAFIAMSVFRPAELPALFDAHGKSFYLFQSPDDKITPFDHALQAESTLRGAGARVQLKRYAGGHGWHTGLKGTAEAFRWLDEPMVETPEE